MKLYPKEKKAQTALTYDEEFKEFVIETLMNAMNTILTKQEEMRKAGTYVGGLSPLEYRELFTSIVNSWQPENYSVPML